MSDHRPISSNEILRRALTRPQDPVAVAMTLDGVAASIVGVPQQRHAHWPASGSLRLGRLVPVLLLLAAVALLAVAVAVFVGSLRPLPGPFAPGANGLVAYDDNGDLLLANFDGTDRRRLTDTVGWEFDPLFSPDGRLMAYWSTTSNSIGPTVPLDLVVIRPGDDRPVPRRLATLSGAAAWRVGWSPDSRRLVYADIVDGNRAIFVVDVDGGSPPPPPGPAGLEGWDPIWSPDGARIGFLGGRVESDRGFYVMSPDGTGVRRISTVPSRG